MGRVHGADHDAIDSSDNVLITLIGIRFALGVGEALVYPSTNCIVSQWIPYSERGIANGIIFAGVGFGAGITLASSSTFWTMAGCG